MRAYRLNDWQQPGFAEIEDPTPGHGQVRVAVKGVGLCHSDVLFLESPAGLLPYEVPFTLGHEISGVVESVGDGVDDIEIGTPVAVACMSPCTKCRFCLQGADNYCVDNWRGRGFGRDGGLAEFVVTNRREHWVERAERHKLAPIGDDAGATSYHAVRRVQPKLRPDSTAVVIGVGGLGAYALQWLRELTGARIVAVEARPERIAAARRLGATEVVEAGEGLSKRLAGAIGPGGADAVLDFVGSDATMRAAMRNAAPLGSVAIVGQGFGAVELRWGSLPHDCDLFIPQGATIRELHEVVALAQTGAIEIEAETFSFQDTPAAYERLIAGTLNGRAVVEL